MADILGRLREDAERNLAVKALIRIASMEGFEAGGVVGNNKDGRELQARVQFARDCLDLIGVKHSASPGLTPAEHVAIEQVLREFRSGIQLPQSERTEITDG